MFSFKDFLMMIEHSQKQQESQDDYVLFQIFSHSGHQNKRMMSEDGCEWKNII